MEVTVRFVEASKEYTFGGIENNPFEELQTHIYTNVGIPRPSQILLTKEGLSLKDKKNQLQVPSLIYLFSKESLRKESLTLDLEIHEGDEEIADHLEGEERGVLLLERDLHSQAAKATRLLNRLTGIQSAYSRLQNEMQMSQDASAVLENYHSNHIQGQITSFKSLQERFAKHYSETQEELQYFEKAVGKLKSIQLHSSLQNERRQTLADIIDLTQLSNWKNQFSVEIHRLQEKFKEVEQSLEGLSGSFKLEPYNPVDLPAFGLSGSTSASIQQARETYKEYRELCVKYLGEGDAVAGARLHEESWGAKLQNLTESLKEAENDLEKATSEVQQMKSIRKEAASQLLRMIKQVTEAAIKLRDSLKSQVNMLHSLLKRSEKRLGFIKVPKLLPEAYSATLLEISRRRIFVKKAMQMQNELNALVKTEIEARKDFLNKYRHVLPSEFVPQLSSAPCTRAVNIGNEPDFQLPAIDSELPQDVERVHLIGSSQELKLLKNQLEESQKREKDTLTELQKAKKDLNSKEQEVNFKEKAIEETRKYLEDFRNYIKDLEIKNSEMKLKLDSQSARIKEVKTLKDFNKNLTLQLKTTLQELNLESVDQIKPYFLSLRNQLQELQDQVDSMICFNNFPEGSLGLFFPTPEGNFLAFNYNAPYHFLDLESLPAKEELSSLPFVVGHIKSKQTFVATQGNPYMLPSGTTYTLLSIQQISLI